MAVDATTAMTIDFLRARLLSERSVSRAAKERADQFSKRVAELEEQLRTVTTQRRKAERAAAEVLAILESQGFDRFSDAADSDYGDDDETGGPESAECGSGGKARVEAEDALSSSELGGPTGAPQAAGALSWKGRAGSPDSDRRQPHQKVRQLRQRHSHNNHRRSYFYLLTADSSPKYQPGQSCRKIKRKELIRLQTEGEDGKDNVALSLEEQERSDCTVCTDEQHDLDGEVSQDGRGSCCDRRTEDVNKRYTMEYEKDEEMERVLEKQAEFIGQYEAEENAQREWEKKFSGSQDSTVDDVDLDNKLNQNEQTCKQRGKAAQILDRQVVCEEIRSSDKDLFGINSSSECLLNGSSSGLSTNVPELYQPSRDDVGGVLEALQRAKISLREKLRRPSPPSQDMLTLPAPEDHYTNDDLPVNDTELSLCISQRFSQEILSLPASEDCLNRIDLPGDDAKVPVGPAGLFRLPTDLFPQNRACSTDGYGSRFSLTSSQQTIYSSNPANNIMSTASLPQYGSQFSLNPYYHPHNSMLLLMPIDGGHNFPVSDFATGDGSFIPETRSSNVLRRGMPSGDASMLFQYSTAYNQ
ncbi:hypothetical protein BRADI_2g23810v3 [Brachypodium distachyon]|uniref:Uncharacterized protein n=1 Tax=Brachypodium distachyon TaxID=15368 RepID=A0A2K2DA69_BRADI|nr:hypothetical protein BRADI_2g23810v3 [Brachypodium distachyon]